MNNITLPEEKLLKWFKLNVKYGIVSKKDNRKIIYNKFVIDEETERKFQDLCWSDYILQQPDEFKKSKVGLCFDQALYSYSELNKYYKSNMYFIQQYCEGYVHLFTVYEKDNLFYRFENSLYDTSINTEYNIYEHKNLNDLLNKVYKIQEVNYPINKGFGANIVEPFKLLNKKLNYKKTLEKCGFSESKHLCK